MPDAHDHFLPRVAPLPVIERAVHEPRLDRDRGLVHVGAERREPRLDPQRLPGTPTDRHPTAVLHRPPHLRQPFRRSPHVPRRHLLDRARHQHAALPRSPVEQRVPLRGRSPERRRHGVLRPGTDHSEQAHSAAEIVNAGKAGWHEAGEVPQHGFVPVRGDIQPQPLPLASPQPEGFQVGDHSALGREDRPVDHLPPVPIRRRRTRHPVRHDAVQHLPRRPAMHPEQPPVGAVHDPEALHRRAVLAARVTEVARDALPPVTRHREHGSPLAEQPQDFRHANDPVS